MNTSASEHTALWSHRWENYYAVVVVVLAAFLIAMNQFGPENPFFGAGRWLIMPLFFFFMVAFVPTTIALVREVRRRPVSRNSLICYSAVLVLTLLLQPHVQPYLLPFDSLHARGLEKQALEQHVVGQSEAAAVAILGKPTFSVDIDVSGSGVDHASRQLRYRHWWFMWDPMEFFIVVEGDRVVRIGVKY